MRQWWELPASERRLLLLLAVLQPTISLLLRLIGFKRTQQLLDRRGRHPRSRIAERAEWKEVQRLAELARIAGRHGMIETTCLPQSLAVYWLLLRRGLEPTLRVGVDRLHGGLPDMHAWVELDGEPLAQAGLRHAAFPFRTSSTRADAAQATSGKRA